MSISDSFQTALDKFVGFLPNLIGFLVILVVGYIVAKIVAGVVRKVLEKMGLDRRLRESEASKYVEGVLPGASAANGIARVVFWLVFIFFLFSAIGALQIPAVTTFMNQVLAYLPNVIAAILIFVVAALVAGAVAGAVTKFMGDTPTGKIVTAIVPALVMVIALFMILNQLQIAEEIVSIAFAATMGALALGLALAFGLGGRDVARRMLEDAYARSSEARDQARQDFQAGRNRAEDAFGGGDTAESATVGGYRTGEGSHVADSHGAGTYDGSYGTGTTDPGAPPAPRNF